MKFKVNSSADNQRKNRLPGLNTLRRRTKKVGLPPGSVVYTGSKLSDNVKITMIDYDENNLTEKQIGLAECIGLKDTPSITWINVDGINNTKVIEQIGNCFGIHPLIMEDIVSTGQRPKIDLFDDKIFILLKMMYFDADGEIVVEQVSLVIGANFVISFQESDEKDVFDNIRDRLRNSIGKIRKKRSDYLAYSIMDAIVDNYFLIVEKLGEKIELLETDLLDNPTPTILRTTMKMKRDMIFLRKAVWPLREVLSTIERGESPLIQENTMLYFRDVYDHTIQVIDIIETFRDTLSGMVEIYLSSVSNKMNEVMKVLTIIATIFIPLTFIVGVYGMNFENLPELKWQYGYFFLWGIMLAIALGMLWFFRRKRWI